MHIISKNSRRAEAIDRKLLGSCGINANVLFRFGSDGAPVIDGTKTGVATRLKAINPELIAIHCRAHRVALASSKSAQEVPYMKIFESHLVSLYYQFTNSPVCEAGLNEIQEIMNEPV